MTAKREVTEFDLRAEPFKHPSIKPEDYEFRDDGVIVRKDRWESAVRQLASAVGMPRDFEIGDVVDKITLELDRQGANDKAAEVLVQLRSSVQACMANTGCAKAADLKERHAAYATVMRNMTQLIQDQGLELP